MSSTKENIATIIMSAVFIVIAILGLVLYPIKKSKISEKVQEQQSLREHYKQSLLWSFPTDAYVAIDPDTGVRYIIAVHSGAGYGASISITPRYNKDGTLYIDRREKEEEE